VIALFSLSLRPNVCTYVCMYICVYVCTYVCHYRTKDKGQKLKEVRQQQQFIQAVEDVEQWIREVEIQLSSEDLGKDLTSVNNLLKKHIVSDYDVHI